MIIQLSQYTKYPFRTDYNNNSVFYHNDEIYEL